MGTRWGYSRGGLRYDRSYVAQLTDRGFGTVNASQILDVIDESQKQRRSNVPPVTGNRRYSMLLVNSSEYKEGEAAFGCGLTTRDNPYPFRSPEYWRWQEGLMGNCRPRRCPEPCK